MSFYIYNQAIKFDLPDNFKVIESGNKGDVCSHIILKKTAIQEEQYCELTVGKITEIEVSFNNGELESYEEVFAAIAKYFDGSKYFITHSPCECMIINVPVCIEESKQNESGIIIVVPTGDEKMVCILISGSLDSDNENDAYKNALIVASALTIKENKIPIFDFTSDNLKTALKLSFDEKESVDVSDDLFSLEKDNGKSEENNDKVQITKKREKVRIELIDAKLEFSRMEKMIESYNESIKTDEARLEEKRQAFADYIDSNMAELEYNKSRITSEQIKQRTLIKELESRMSEMEKNLEETKKDLEGTSFFKFSLKKELSSRIEALDSKIRECNDSLMIEKTKLDGLDDEFKTKVLSHQQKIDSMENDIDALIEHISESTSNSNDLAKTVEIKRRKVTELENELNKLQV